MGRHVVEAPAHSHTFQDSAGVIFVHGAGMRWYCWNISPMFWLRNMVFCLGPSEVTVVSPIFTVPDEGESRQAMMLRSVVLPEPEGPMMLTHSPLDTEKVTLCSASVLSS
jgi:hypothetical protein